MPPLPTLMVAPNGARRTKADHPALPVTIPEIVATAKACFEAGADGLHAHVRDGDQRHVLDAGLYRELLSELSAQVPDLAVQITTEAVGQYSPPEQRAVVREVMPKAVSVALSEMLSDGDEP
ncbi:MAG: 3-keto-5-aminohexanoate cleavage protein, partial [Pseudomonadota bacterium]